MKALRNSKFIILIIGVLPLLNCEKCDYTHIECDNCPNCFLKNTTTNTVKKNTTTKATMKGTNFTIGISRPYSGS